MSLIGTHPQTRQLCKRLLAHDRSNHEILKSEADDWVRVLAEKSLWCIWACYEEAIREDTPWMPSLGQFFARVESKERWIESLATKLRGYINQLETSS